MQNNVFVHLNCYKSYKYRIGKRELCDVVSRVGRVTRFLDRFVFFFFFSVKRTRSINLRIDDRE